MGKHWQPFWSSAESCQVSDMHLPNRRWHGDQWHWLRRSQWHTGIPRSRGTWHILHWDGWDNGCVVLEIVQTEAFIPITIKPKGPHLSLPAFRFLYFRRAVYGSWCPCAGAVSSCLRGLVVSKLVAILSRSTCSNRRYPLRAKDALIALQFLGCTLKNRLALIQQLVLMVLPEVLANKKSCWSRDSRWSLSALNPAVLCRARTGGATFALHTDGGEEIQHGKKHGRF